MSHKCALSQCPRTQNTDRQIHTQSQYHLHLPIQRTSLSWVGWKKKFTDNETAELKAGRCTTSAATSFTQIKHTHSNEFAPLASPVESSEIRETCASRPSNIVHIFSHSAPEQMMITTSSPRVDSTSSVQHPEHPHASQAAASPTYLSRHLTQLLA